MANTGLNIIVYASAKELENTKNGGTMIMASKRSVGASNIQVSVPLDACEILAGGEIRVNMELIKKHREGLATEVGEKMWQAMGAELQKAMEGA